MTVSSSTLNFITVGDDSTTVFPFTGLNVYATSDIVVKKEDSAGNITTLVEGTGATNYSVALNSTTLPSDGNVTYPASGGTPLSTAEKISIRRVLTIEQTLDLLVQGGYDPDTLETTLDKIVMMLLQHEEWLNRAVVTDEFDADGTGISDLASDLAFVVANFSTISTAVAALNVEPHKTNLGLVADDIANVNTVAANIADVNTVAGISGDVTSVAAALPLGGAATEDVAAGGVGDLLREDGDGSALTGITDREFALSADISPAQLTANTNDWNPAGLSTASVIRFSTDASRDITGIAGGADGRILLLHNIGSNNAVLKNDATSTAANRFLTPNAADFTLGQQESVAIQYDSTSSRWRVLSVADSSTTGSWVLIGTATASASASISVTGIDATYPTYIIMGEDLHPVTDGALPRLRLGDSGGVDSGASDYTSSYFTNFENAAITGSYILLTPSTVGIGADPGESISFDGKLHQMRGTEGYPSYNGQSIYVATTGVQSGIGTFGRRNSAITTDRVEFSFSTGNIASGRITVWGVSST